MTEIDVKVKKYMEHFNDIKDTILLEIIESAFREGLNGVPVAQYLNKFREIRYNNTLLFDVVESAVIHGYRERFSHKK